MDENETTQFDILDHNIAAGYVTYIVDLWKGDRTDPAVDVSRYIGVWNEGQLELPDGEAFDPKFAEINVRRYRPKPEPEPLVWEIVGETKKSSSDARGFKRDIEGMLGESGYFHAASYSERELFKKFMAAIDTLATDPTDDQALSDINAWRNHLAMAHEK